MVKKFYEIDTIGQFDKNLFGHNLCCYQHIGLSFDLGYIARCINYGKKSFMKINISGQFDKTFLGVIYAAIGILA
jgi:hypothetical protein